MKKSLIFTGCPLTFIFAVMLAMLTGCPQSSTVAPPASSQPVQPGVTSVNGVIEPLVPAPASDEKKPNAQEEEKPELKEGAKLVPALPTGKIAAESVPMPPIEDLISQIDRYVETLGTTLEELDGTANYKNDGDFVVRDANALALIALAVGKADADSKYKKAAPGIIKAAAELAAVTKYDDAKKAYDALKTSLTSEGNPAALEWTKVAELQPLMKAVPNLSSTLTRLTNTEKKLKSQLKKPERVFGILAALAVIPQGSIANIKDTSKPDAVAEWKKECEQFRDAAIKANIAIHDYAAEKID
ncbi:MAG: hypothetical protein LBQ50_01305, partial [Planctomycetaceae bacterium]|nr:hypothetical protein [Planctomycetaceae bacterium]